MGECVVQRIQHEEQGQVLPQQHSPTPPVGLGDGAHDGARDGAPFQRLCHRLGLALSATRGRLLGPVQKGGERGKAVGQVSLENARKRKGACEPPGLFHQRRRGAGGGGGD